MKLALGQSNFVAHLGPAPLWVGGVGWVGRGGRGFTLIEMLAVIVIVSLIATVATVGLSSANGGAELLRIVSAVRELDERGRLHARTSGQAVAMVIELEEAHVRLLSMTDREQLALLDLPHGIDLTIENSHEPGAVIFDRQGRSGDYEVRVRSVGSERRWLVNGLTGFMQPEAIQ